jgi:hypothetical protein
MQEERGMRPDIFRNSGNPEVPPEQLPQLTRLNALLWNFANDTIAKGRPVEHVAQAFIAYVGFVAYNVRHRSYRHERRLALHEVVLRNRASSALQWPRGR